MRLQTEFTSNSIDLACIRGNLAPIMSNIVLTLLLFIDFWAEGFAFTPS